MKGAYFYQDEAYVVLDANIDGSKKRPFRFIRYILQKVGESRKNYLIVTERVKN